MAALNSRDRTSLALMQSKVLVDDAIFFLRKIENYTDAAIRVATDDQLKILAQRFCCRNSQQHFPNTVSSDMCESDTTAEAVFMIFRDLKIDLLNGIRLRRPVRAAHTESSMCSSVPKVVQKSASTEMRSTDRFRTSIHKPRRQGQRQKERTSKIQIQELDVINLCHDSVIDREAMGHDKKYNNDEDAVSLCHREGRIDSGSSQTQDSRSHAYQITQSNMDFDRLAIIEVNQRLLEENDRLQVEIQTLHAYGTFVRTSLRVCYDTYLEETLMARRACIYQKALQCNAVVETLKDLQSDLDPECFQSHFLRHGSAPPSRYWLDGVQKRQEMYTISSRGAVQSR